jgi:hypothetical protein
MSKGSRQYPSRREPLKTHRRVVRPHEPIQGRSSHNFKPIPAEQLIETVG